MMHAYVASSIEEPHPQVTVFLQPCRHLKEVAVGKQRVTICPERSSESGGAFRRMPEDGRYASGEPQDSIGLERGRPENGDKHADPSCVGAALPPAALRRTQENDGGVDGCT